MTDPDPLEDLPPRAQVGYVLKHSTVKQGELTPATVVGMLVAKGVTVRDAGNMRDLANEVMKHSPHVEWDGGEDDDD